MIYLLEKLFGERVRDWIIAEKILQPDIYVYSNHEYQTNDKRLIGMGYFYNPEVDGVPAPKNTEWDTSEYHMSKVHKYPEHEAFLKKYISISASLVMRFNELNKVKRYFKKVKIIKKDDNVKQNYLRLLCNDIN